MEQALRSARRLVFIVFVAVFGFFAALVVVFRQPQLPVVTHEELTSARQRWAAAAIADYDVEVVVTGRQGAVYAVEVRHGEVRSARRDGQPLSGLRTIGTWSVPGMFATLESDVDNQRRVAAGTADRDTPSVDLLASFEPTLGYPLRCQRVPWKNAGRNLEVTWEVRRFQRLSQE